MSREGSNPSTGVLPRARRKTKRPRMFRVLLHNDNYTTMEFVVQILKDVFSKKTEDAVRIMLAVHHLGVGVCGSYSAQVAETKVNKVHQRAQEHGFPLKCSMEPD